MKKWFRNTKLFAFLQGTYETFRWGSSTGRTHPTNHGWNEAYDHGMNMGERLRAIVH